MGKESEQYVRPSKRWWKILIIILAVLILLGIYLYFQLFPKQVYVHEDLPKNITEVTPNIIRALLYEIGANNLHKNPITKDKPELCVVVDEKEYYVLAGKNIEVLEESCKGIDLTLVTTAQEVIDSVQSDNIKARFRDSVANAKTVIVINSTQTDLAAKGYISLYNSIAG